ncbi:sugar transferase [Falsirhodobacter algicola]|uniref:Exopolysaccharide biosynthesis UDP-galactose-lipid carrier transferase n=1 Tax=Falsirhodobacter algicola TaxID=2692330 RepID=A0A8J8SK54_9RHOB|nr:sugar transferase [Falsirhodobacter algicola]QUS35113.1 exopolysaccharide biosynthesis UDP-galactose-lipid carrier transferase [Falsirhodobacter algicola]
MIPRNDLPLPTAVALPHPAAMRGAGLPLRAIGLVLADAAALWAAFAVATLIVPAAAPRAGMFAVAGALIIAMRAGAGLLPGRGLHPHEVMRRSLFATLAAGLVLGVALLGVDRDPALAAALALFVALALPLQHAARLAARRLLHALRLWGAPVHIMAAPELLPRIDDFFRRNWQYGLIPTAASVAPIVLVTDAGVTQDQGHGLHDRYREVILLADMPQMRIAGLRPADVGGTIGLRLARPQPARGDAVLKRLCDLAVAVPMLMLAAPIIALAAAAIWIADPGPVFYSQAREGRDRRPLRVLKLRTMYRDAERILQDVLQNDPAARAEWAAHFKLKKDPRILPVVGNLLRATSCDELPQLWNVITGGMSLVGPRPFPEYHLAAMRPEFRRKRCTVPPGITGLWQISNRSDADIDQQQQLDEFYIDNRSFWLDLSILLRTVPAVLLRRGAY